MTVTTTIESHTVDVDYMTLSTVVWSRFKKRMPGMVERIYAENPALANLGPILPRGTVVRIPVDVSTEPEEVAVVSLWS